MDNEKSVQIDKGFFRDINDIFARQFSGLEALAYALSAALDDGNLCINIRNYCKKQIGIHQLNGNLDRPNPFFDSEETFIAQVQNTDFVTDDP